MRRTILICIIGITGWGTVLGQSPQKPTIEVHVAGMVCAFCIQGIEKTLLALKDVDSININLKTKVVTVIQAKPDAVSDEHIRKANDDARYEVTKIVRSGSVLSPPPVTLPKSPAGQIQPKSPVKSAEEKPTAVEKW